MLNTITQNQLPNADKPMVKDAKSWFIGET
jgi:hypothetical protein